MTHDKKVLQFMKSHHGAITSLEAFKYLHNTRLSATIFRLRKKGYEIDTEMESYKNIDGALIRYGKYYLRGEPNEKN